jgi:phosphatidate cytidylyltransferase
MDSYLFPYLLLMAHFVSGALWLIRINRKLEPAAARKQWIKYTTYLILTNLIWYCLVFFPRAFPFLGILLMLLAAAEWWRAIHKLERKVWFILLFLVVLAGFWDFLYLDQARLLFTWFVVVLFDGSCQIAGQVAGKRKLLSRISPRKTVEGLAGGAVLTLATSLLVRHSFSLGWTELILLTCLVMAAAFLGDLLASLVKRKAGIESYGKIMPGHGGVLDRFDSLIMAGALVYLISLIETLIR